MTVGEILDTALTLLFETRQSAQDYVSFAPVTVNTLLPELFGMNNQLRAARGLPELEEIPTVQALEDEVPYEQAIVQEALPYGLAANLLLGDEEQGRAVDYMTLYSTALENLLQALPQTVEDVYK